jgi:hypothetical protein
LRKIIAAISSALTLSLETLAAGPNFSASGGVGSSASRYATTDGELTGGAYPINGATGVAILGGLVLPSQVANNVLATPLGGGTPAFRPLTGSDVPPVNNASAANGGFTGTLAVSNGSTSASNPAARAVLAGPIGAAAAPSFRDLMGSDIPAAAATHSAIVGTLPIANGGTGTASAAASMIFASPTGAAGASSVRALAATDRPDIAAAKSTVYGVQQSMTNWLEFATGQGIVPGCIGNGTADDTACLQAAITAYQGGTLYLGTGIYRITAGLTSAGPITIVGGGGGTGAYGTACTAGIRVAAANVAALTINAAGSRVTNTCIDMASGVAPAGGAGFVTGAGSNSSVIAYNACYGLMICVDVTGAGSTQTADVLVFANQVVPFNSSAAAAFRIGNKTIAANTVDNWIENNGIYCYNSPRATGILILDGGGTLIKGNTPYACSYGTRIFPGANQQVIWSYFLATVLGDTSVIADLSIDTAASSAQIRGNQFVGTWASSAAATNVKIMNTAGGILQGTRFTGHRTYNSNTNGIGFDIIGGSEFAIDDSTICSSSAGNSGTAIKIEVGASDSSIRNNVIGACDNSGATMATGVSVTQTSGLVGIITGNDILGTTTALTFSPSAGNGSTAVIDRNLGIDNQNPTIASAATISLPVNPIVLLTGITTVTTINGGWSNRHVTLIATGSGGLSFATGGNICTGVTAPQSIQMFATFLSGSNCWAIK